MRIKNTLLCATLLTGCGSNALTILGKNHTGFQQNGDVVECNKGENSYEATNNATRKGRSLAGLINAKIQILIDPSGARHLEIENDSLIGTYSTSSSYDNGLACSVINTNYLRSFAKEALSTTNNSPKISYVCTSGFTGEDVSGAIRTIFKQNNDNPNEAYRIVDIKTNQFGVCINYLKERKKR